MPKLYALMVVKDEAGRYMEACIQHLRPQVEDVFVYDDRSTDDTTDIAGQAGCMVSIRRPDQPSFLEHEGQFRQNAWLDFQQFMRPKVGDWVLAIDSDEFLVEDSPGTVQRLLNQAEYMRAKSLFIRLPEIFDIRDGVPYTRMDGLWNTILCTRIFRYEEGGTMADKPMACGSEPTYIQVAPKLPANGLYLLHYGYANKDDVQEKYKRYTSLLDHGHNNMHVQSIITEPVLHPWGRAAPEVWRGRRG